MVEVIGGNRFVFNLCNTIIECTLEFRDNFNERETGVLKKLEQ
jgi:hypothetical protein